MLAMNAHSRDLLAIVLPGACLDAAQEFGRDVLRDCRPASADFLGEQQGHDARGFHMVERSRSKKRSDLDITPFVQNPTG